MRQSVFRDLERALYPLVPGPPDRTWFVITCASQFEPHGRASEDWEIVYTLALNEYPHHWKGADGIWVQGVTDRPIVFKDRTAEACVARAISFINGQKITNQEYRDRVSSGYYRRLREEGRI